MLHTLFRDSGSVKLGLLHRWSALAVPINTVGFMLMQCSKTYQAKIYEAGCGLIYGSAVIYYATQAVAIDRLPKPQQRHNPRYIVFRVLFPGITIVIVVTGGIAFIYAKECLPLVSLS
jgi:hypothetical protein